MKTLVRCTSPSTFYYLTIVLLGLPVSADNHLPYVYACDEHISSKSCPLVFFVSYENGLVAASTEGALENRSTSERWIEGSPQARQDLQEVYSNLGKENYPVCKLLNDAYCINQAHNTVLANLDGMEISHRIMEISLKSTKRLFHITTIHPRPHLTSNSVALEVARGFSICIVVSYLFSYFSLPVLSDFAGIAAFLNFLIPVVNMPIPSPKLRDASNYKYLTP